MSEHAAVESMREVLCEHAAAAAWRLLHPESPVPTRVIVLREVEKSGVYCLQGIGPHGTEVVAKRCRPATAAIERAVYEDLLPDVGVTALEYHGCVVEDGAWWLFVEHARGVRLSLGLREHRVLAAHWLATLHTSAARREWAARLPQRGPAHYLEELREGRRALLSAATNPALAADDVRLLDAIIRQCDILESRWRELEESCAEMPSTLVHGDFRPKNVHVRTGVTGSHLLAMDWEMAGWGVPAVDLAPARGLRVDAVDIETYCAVARRSWPNLDVRTLWRQVHVGRVFRRLAAIGWDSARVASPWPGKAMAAMRVYHDELAAAIEGAAWRC